MPRKRSPLFQKVSDLLRISLFIPKLRKPVIPKLLLLKRFRKRKEFKLLRHYNNGFLGEYQFSPSRTPLIHIHGKQFKNRGYRDLCSLLFLYRCLGDLKAEGNGNGGVGEYQVEALPVPATEDGVVVAEDLFEPFGSADEDEDESVDQRAERFIERFYREMKMQRQESI